MISYLVAIEGLVSSTKSTGGLDGKEKLVYIGMQSILDGLHWFQYEGFSMNASSNSSRKFFLVAVSYCCGLTNKKDMSVVRHATMIDRPCNQFLVSLKISQVCKGQLDKVWKRR